jgi:hypothetical protein
MVDDFSNRIDAQRVVLEAVNSREWKEELFGLSRSALLRWTGANRMEPSSPLVKALELVSEKLQFLANKSQEQITEEYRALSQEVAAITASVRRLVSTA